MRTPYFESLSFHLWSSETFFRCTSKFMGKNKMNVIFSLSQLQTWRHIAVKLEIQAVFGKGLEK
jgi:hypothetical protein